MISCATTSRDQAEPLAGTAAFARTWLLVEQPGPWGSKALTQSRLDPALGRDLDAAGTAGGVRVALIRRPGRHADTGPSSGRRVFLAHTAPGRSWLRSARVTDPEILRTLDMGRLGAGEHDGFGRPHLGDPLALVCTNGKRDRCCAVLGRPLAAELAASGDVDAWEITHIGGHRFSPTLLVLPYGYAYGRMSAPEVKQVLHEVRGGRVVTERCRGRSTWDRPAQAAELALRKHIGETRAGALDVLEVREGPARLRTQPPAADREAPHWRVTVGHTDGRRWEVAVAEGSTLPASPASCGAALL
ncbi:sucrase ferredoxin, partial [Streptomyces sp. SM14]|uniref:sucrase ferredoxin n=2 Tax=unclassified Streptomyces TaxID=2593676 RepID=UPI000CD5AC47